MDAAYLEFKYRNTRQLHSQSLELITFYTQVYRAMEYLFKSSKGGPKRC